MGSVTFWGPLDTSFLFAQIVGARWPQKTSVFGPQTLHYAKFWAQNVTKTSAGNVPESLSNLSLRDNCRLSQRLLNNANICMHNSRKKHKHTYTIHTQKMDKMMFLYLPFLYLPLLSFNVLHDWKKTPRFLFSCNLIFQDGAQELILPKANYMTW